VALEWRRTGAGMQVNLEVPVNVTARVALPVTAGKSYRAAGPSKAVFVGIEDGRAVFEVGSGRSSFHPVSDAAAQPR
jgi:alpha-L-rhamnosidase